MTEPFFQNADRYFMDRHAVEDLVKIQQKRPGDYWLSNWFLSLVDLLAAGRCTPGSLRRMLPEAEALDHRKFAEAAAMAAKPRLLMAFAHLQATWVAFDEVPGEAPEPLARMLAWIAGDFDGHWAEFFGEHLAFEGKPSGPMRNLSVFHAVGQVLAWLEAGLTQRYAIGPAVLAEARVLNHGLVAFELDEAGPTTLAFDFTQSPGNCAVRAHPDAVVAIALLVSGHLRQAHVARNLSPAASFKRGAAANQGHYSLRRVVG